MAQPTAYTSVNSPFPNRDNFDELQGLPGIAALQDPGLTTAVVQTGQMSISGKLVVAGTITGSNLVSGNVKVGTLGTVDADAENWIEQASASKTPFVIQAKASPTDNLFEIQDSTGAIIRAVGPLGQVYGGGTVSDPNILATAAAVDLNTATAVTVFTVPTGKSCVIDRFRVRLASTSLTTVSFSIGYNSTSFNDVLADATHTELTGNTLYTILVAKAGAKIGTTGQALKLLCNTLQGGACTVTVDVIGSLF